MLYTDDGAADTRNIETKTAEARLSSACCALILVARNITQISVRFPKFLIDCKVAKNIRVKQELAAILTKLYQNTPSATEQEKGDNPEQNRDLPKPPAVWPTNHRDRESGRDFSMCMRTGTSLN